MIPLLHKLVLKDFWLKLFSLALAVLIWFTVNTALSLGPGGQRVLAGLPVVTVVTASSAEAARSFSVNPKTVSVTVQGDPRILSILQKKDIRVLVDLTGLPAAHNLRRPVEVSTPAGVTYVRVDPEEVEIVSPPSD
jgi:hypothetical protein